MYCYIAHHFSWDVIYFISLVRKDLREQPLTPGVPPLFWGAAFHKDHLLLCLWRWVQRKADAHYKERRVNACLNLSLILPSCGENVHLSSIFEIKVLWAHFFVPSFKLASHEWEIISSLNALQARLKRKTSFVLIVKTRRCGHGVERRSGERVSYLSS